MPIVSQVSLIVTPSPFIGMPNCSIVGPSGASLIGGAGHEQVCGRRSAGEDLASIDPIATVALHALPRPIEPVRAAGGQQLKPLGRSRWRDEKLVAADPHSAHHPG